MIYTQVQENYGYIWKAKGGNEYFVDNVDHNSPISSMLEQAKELVEWASDEYQEYVVGWEVVEDNYLTAYELDQLQYEQQITYRAQKIVVANHQ